MRNTHTNISQPNLNIQNIEHIQTEYYSVKHHAYCDMGMFVGIQFLQICFAMYLIIIFRGHSDEDFEPNIHLIYICLFGYLISDTVGFIVTAVILALSHRQPYFYSRIKYMVENVLLVLNYLIFGLGIYLLS